MISVPFPHACKAPKMHGQSGGLMLGSILAIVVLMLTVWCELALLFGELARDGYI